MAAEPVERHAAVVPHDVVLVPERCRAVVGGEGVRELAGVAVGVPAEELRLPAGQVRLGGRGSDREGEGEGHRAASESTSI